MGNAINKIIGIDIGSLNIKMWCCSSARWDMKDVQTIDNVMHKVTVILILHKQCKVSSKFDDTFCLDIFAVIKRGDTITYKQARAVNNIYRKFNIKEKEKLIDYSELIGG